MTNRSRQDNGGAGHLKGWLINLGKDRFAVYTVSQQKSNRVADMHLAKLNGTNHYCLSFTQTNIGLEIGRVLWIFEELANYCAWYHCSNFLL